MENTKPKSKISINNKESYNKMMETKQCLCAIEGIDSPCMCYDFLQMEEGICDCGVFIKEMI